MALISSENHSGLSSFIRVNVFSLILNITRHLLDEPSPEMLACQSQTQPGTGLSEEPLQNTPSEYVGHMVGQESGKYQIHQLSTRKRTTGTSI